MEDHEFEVIEAAAGGNHAAATLLHNWVNVLHTWDDLIDQDRAVVDSVLNNAMYTALVAIPNNPFFVAYSSQLLPVLGVSIANWLAATQIERSETSEHELDTARIIRSSYVDLIVQVAHITQGPQMAAAIARRVRAVAHKETLPQYLENLQHETEARETKLHHETEARDVLQFP